MQRNIKRVLANTLVAAMAVGMMFQNGAEASAAKKVKLSSKTVSVKVGKTKKVSVKNAKGAKITWKVKNKKIASVSKSGKYAGKVKAKKKGNTVLTCKVKKRSKTTTLKCKIKVIPAKSSASSKPEATAKATLAAATSTPAPTIPAKTMAPTAPAVPTATAPVPTATSPSTEFQPVVYKSASFETGTDGFTPRAGGEKLSSVEGGHTGNALLVTGRTDSWNGVSLDLTSDIVKGAKYTFAAWVKQDTGSDAAIKMSCLLNTDSYPEVATVTTKSGEWTYIEGEYEVPTSFTSLSVYFESPSLQFDFMVDDVVITQTTKGKDVIDPMTLPSLKDAYGEIFTNFGTCLNYYGYGVKKDQMRTESTMKFVQKQFNSFTLENEMKPDSVLGNSITKLTKEAAVAKGYTIPDNYTEENVPQLNFDTIDASLEAAKQYGIRMRAHTLMWHQQTPSWFFKQNYTTGVADADSMDARLEFYVRTVMRHVMDKEIELTGKAGTLVYAWDVTNEYLHRSNAATNPSWVSVYGDMELRPTYVKKAFQFAYDELKNYSVQNEVVLYNNDYDTYFCADDEVSLVNYINEGEEANICGGIGMQSHVDVDRPTLEQYGATVDKFMATGLEIQVTELDMTINFSGDSDTDKISSGQTDKDQAAYASDLMKLLVEKQKNRDTAVNAKGITGITIWGLFDACSWRSANAPLLFGSGINDPKESFYSVIEAAK